jgi:putative ABC transport system permease protein
MFKNYIKTAIRHLWRHKGYSLINILGLAVGIACCLIILLYVQDELSFDKFHEKGDRIYRVALDRQYPGRSSSYAIIPHSYAQEMKDEFPDVEEAVRLFYFQGNNVTLQVGEQIFEEPHYMWADSTFFEVFSIPVLKGDPAKALTEPNSLVLTESRARRFFGDADPIGQVIRVPGNDNDLVVKAVCGDLPENSHMRFGMLASLVGLPFFEQQNFIGFSAYTYLLLREGADPDALEAKFPGLVRKYAAGPIQREFSVTYDEYVKAGNGYHYYLQPLPDIYLESNLESEMRPPGSKTRVYIFTVIALFILLIAIINFMNLATAKSTERAKEVGIRKTMGSLRGQLMVQFLFEAVLMTLVSTGLALVFLYALIPPFNSLSGKEMQFTELFHPSFVPSLLVFSIIVGILAGSYPAAVLSRFKPVSVLKGKLAGTRHGGLLRNGLVVFQFTISVVLIISTIVVYRQMQFIRNKELGFNKDQVVSVEGAFALQSQTEAFKEELLKLPEVVSVGACNSMPGGTFFGVGFRKEGDNETIFGRGVFIDEDFIDCMEMEMVEGRTFSRQYNDTMSVILNQTAVGELGLQDPVGKRLETTDDNILGAEEETAYLHIVGIVEDFHFQSLHQPITPLFFVLNRNPEGANALLSVRLKGDRFQETIQRMENMWKTFVPDQPFRYSFLDAKLGELYEAEQVAQRVFAFFAGLAIFIACLGLFGLAAFVTRQRTKEIGVRKVLGATVANIVRLLSLDFLKLVGLALLIAAPVAWLAMNRWLESFAYRVGLSWWVFVLAGLLAVFIAFLTVSYQSIRAAMADPVKSLRDE